MFFKKIKPNNKPIVKKTLFSRLGNFIRVNVHHFFMYIFNKFSKSKININSEGVDINNRSLNEKLFFSNKGIEQKNNCYINSNSTDRKYLRSLGISYYIDHIHNHIILPSDSKHFNIFDEKRGGYYLKYGRDKDGHVISTFILRKRKVISF